MSALPIVRRAVRVSPKAATCWQNQKAKEALKTEAAGTFQVVLSSTASHSGMLSLVPCQRFMLHVEGQVSADATVLGMPKELLKTMTIFKKDIDQPIPNAKICTG